MTYGAKYQFLKLSKLRADKGMTKTELARRSGISVTTIRDVENRKGKKRETLMKIFNSLNNPDLYDGDLDSREYVVELKD